jgi:hypothetical protein
MTRDMKLYDVLIIEIGALSMDGILEGMVLWDLSVWYKKSTF